MSAILWIKQRLLMLGFGSSDRMHVLRTNAKPRQWEHWMVTFLSQQQQSIKTKKFDLEKRVRPYVMLRRMQQKHNSKFRIMQFLKTIWLYNEAFSTKPFCNNHIHPVYLFPYWSRWLPTNLFNDTPFFTLMLIFVFLIVKTFQGNNRISLLHFIKKRKNFLFFRRHIA